MERNERIIAELMSVHQCGSFPKAI